MVPLEVTTFVQSLIDFGKTIGLMSVVFLIVTLYLYLFLLITKWFLLTKSKRDHQFGESLLTEAEPKKIKIKLV